MRDLPITSRNGWKDVIFYIRLNDSALTLISNGPAATRACASEPLLPMEVHTVVITRLLCSRSSNCSRESWSILLASISEDKISKEKFDKRYLLSAPAVLYYDHVDTFSDEVRNFWGRKWTLITLVFFINRYTASIGYVVIVFVLLWPIHTPQEITVRASCLQMFSIFRYDATCHTGIRTLLQHGYSGTVRKRFETLRLNVHLQPDRSREYVLPRSYA